MYKMFVASQHSNIQEKAEIKTLQLGSLSDPYTFPTVDGTTNQILKTDGAGVVSWATDASGSGDVSGTTSSLINEIPIYADTSGKLIGNSGVKLETITGTALAESLYIGYNVYPSVGSGYNETKIGTNIGKSTNSGDWNCMVGSNLATSLSSGSSNCIYGKQIATNLTTGSANTLMGDKVWSTFNSTALVPSGSASTYNTYIGAVSGGDSTGTCYGRTSLGVLANCKYDHSIQLGNAYWEALPSIGAVKSCFLGDSLMMYRDNTTGSMVIGTTSVLPTVTPALANAISIGDDNCTLPNQVSLGNSSAVDLKLGTRNVFKYLGTDSVSALGSVSNPATNVLGICLGLDTGTNLVNNSSSVLIGGACNLASSALQSVYIGLNAGDNNNGSNNVAVGCFALQSATGVAHNTAIGEYSLNNAQTDYNTGIGSNAGGYITTGDGTFIGYNANVSALDFALTDVIAIGKNATADKSGQCMIGNASLTEIVPNASAVCSLGSPTNPFTGLHLKTVYVSTSSTTLQAVVNTEYYLDLTVNDVAITFPATATVGDYFKCTVIGKDADVDKATFVNGTMNVDGGSDDEHFNYHTLWKICDTVSFRYVSSNNWVSYDRNIANRFFASLKGSGAQTFPVAGTYYKLTIDTVVQDYNGDLTGAYEYEVPITGVYDVSMGCYFQGTQANQYYALYLDTDGSHGLQSQSVSPTTVNLTTKIDTKIYLTAGQLISASARTGGTTASASPTQSVISIYLTSRII